MCSLSPFLSLLTSFPLTQVSFGLLWTISVLGLSANLLLSGCLSDPKTELSSYILLGPNWLWVPLPCWKSLLSSVWNSRLCWAPPSLMASSPGSALCALSVLAPLSCLLTVSQMCLCLSRARFLPASQFLNSPLLISYVFRPYTDQTVPPEYSLFINFMSYNLYFPFFSHHGYLHTSFIFLSRSQIPCGWDLTKWKNILCSSLEHPNIIKLLLLQKLINLVQFIKSSPFFKNYQCILWHLYSSERILSFSRD